MALNQALSGSTSLDRARTTRLGGAGFVAAGALLAIGALPFLRGGVGARADFPVWQLLGVPVGAVVLLLASVVLALGRPGESGIVGGSRRRQAALIASGAGPLLLTALALVSFSILPAVSLLLAAVQLLGFATTAVVAVTVLRLGTLPGAARWAFAGLAVLDALALAFALVPTATTLVVVVAAGLRPLAVIVVGVLLLLQRRARRDGARP